MAEVLVSLAWAAYAALVGYAFRKKVSHSIIAAVADFIGLYVGLTNGMNSLAMAALLFPPAVTIILTFSNKKG